MGIKNTPPKKIRSSQEQPIEIEDETKDSATQLLSQRKSPRSSYSAGVSDFSHLISSLPLLQTSTPPITVPTAKTAASSPDFSSLRQRLCSLSGGTRLAPSSSTVPLLHMNAATALTTLRSLMTCTAEDAFGDKASILRNALLCLAKEDTIPQVEKDILQSSLQRLEGNCSAVRTHKPIVEQYKTLRGSIDNHNASVMTLLEQIDKLEAEYNALTNAATILQEQLNTNITRQTEIGNEQTDLQTQTQQLIDDHEANSKALISCQNAYDFSLPVWNAVLLSWENMKDLISRLPHPTSESAATSSQVADLPPEK